MDAKQFLAEFGHIANAPGGVQSLRELIFELMIQGYLLSESENIESINLGSVVELIMGQAPPKSECNVFDEGVVFVKTGQFSELFPVVEEWTTKPLKTAQRGDVLICVVGATIGKLNLAIDCAIGRSVAAIRPNESLITKYLYYALMPFTIRLRSGAKGSAQGVIGKYELENIPIRIPSYEEQSRIVAKVDELMSLCDKLESQQQKKRQLQNKLRQSVLQAVANAESPKELQDSWERLAGNFSHLFAEAEDVAEFKNLVFDLSLRGFLSGVGQFISNSPTQESIPQGWSWTTLGELSEYITSGSRGWKKYHANSGATFIRSQDIRTDSLSFENRAYVSLPEKVEGKRTLVKEGDLLITITGGNVGKCALVPELDCEAYVSQHVALIRLNDNRLSRYIHYWIIDAFGGRKYLSQFIYGDKPGLNLGQVGSIPIPIPPMCQINEIVSRLDYYHNICNELAGKQKKRLTLSARLATAAIASLTGISTSQQEEPATMDEVLV